MSNAFTINSAEQSPTGRHAEQRTRSVQRRLNIAPIHMNYEAISEECATPEKTPEDEESFYPGNSPRRSPGPCPISPCDDETLLSLETSPMSNRFTLVQTGDLVRRSFDTYDPSSMDSGYHAGSEMSSFRFAAPSGVAPRKTPAKLSPKTNSIRIFHSLSSGSAGSADADEYMDLFDMEDDEEDLHMPKDLNLLLSGDIKAVRNTPEHVKRAAPIARRSLSLNESSFINRAKNSLFGNDITPEKITTTPVRKALTPIGPQQAQNSNITPYSSKVCFKRPEPPTNFSPVQSKRYKYDKSVSEHQENIAPLPQCKAAEAPAPARPLFKKSISMNDANIMSALARCKFKNLICFL